MIQIKLFTSTKRKAIEENVNEFLLASSSITVKDIKLSEWATEGNEEDVSGGWTIMVIYEEEIKR